jgi:hypothetical protein
MVSEGQLLLLLLLLLLRQWKYRGLGVLGWEGIVFVGVPFTPVLARTQTIGRVLENAHDPAHSTAVACAVLQHS